VRTKLKHRVKPFAGAIFIYILGVIVIAAVSYMQERERFLVDIDKRLLAAASNIPSILPVDFHDIARSSNAISHEQDQFNLELMTRHTRSGDLTYLYSYVMVDGKIYFTSCSYTADDIAKDQVVTYWTDYPEGAQEYLDAMTASEPLYVTAGDRWGLFRTILMPMTTPSGQPYVAAADMDITVIESSLKHAVLSVLGMSIVLLAIAVPLILAYRRTYSEMNTELVGLNKQLQGDIDQALILEAELKQATHEANVANEIKSQFLSNMSHELRTPINGITGMNQLLLDTELTEEQLEYIELCNHSADVLLGTVNQILDVAAIEAGGLKLHPNVINTEQFFNDIAALFSSQIAEKRLDLVLTLEEGMPAALELDAVQLRKVLINLMSNALKFTEKGGVRVTLHWHDGVLFGEVQDTGMGIPSSEQTRIFEAFQQVDNSYSRKHGGTGLGLPISQQICHMMGGELALLHSDEKGSTFQFNVQLAAYGNELIQAEAVFSERKVCIISDSDMLQDWLDKKIKRLGSEEVARLKAGQNELQTYSHILLDTSLGNEELFRVVKQLDLKNQCLLLMAWTGQRVPAEIKGSVHILRKPLTQNSLIASLPSRRI
jgi:signal transduction histidine kinase